MLLERTVRHTKDCPKCARGEGHRVFVLTVTYPGQRTRQFSVRRESGCRGAPLAEQLSGIEEVPANRSQSTTNGSLSVGLRSAGKGFPRARDRAAFLPCRSALTGNRDRKGRFEPRECRGNLGVLPKTAGDRICVGLRGGAGRTQTDNQLIMGPSRRQDCGPIYRAQPSQAPSRWHGAGRSRQRSRPMYVAA
jgi:hypothetical protein